jgi:putative ABC transport system permease protein
MNLARKDVWHNRGRFALTTLGLGTLLMIVMGMGGIYRGLTTEATQLVDKVGVELWVVQRGTRGRFAEISRVPRRLSTAWRPCPEWPKRGLRLSHHPAPACRQTAACLGPRAGLANRQGRVAAAERRAPLAQAHFEMIADRSLGLTLGERLPLGKEIYTVVA